jgi:hypothetical protein
MVAMEVVFRIRRSDLKKFFTLTESETPPPNQDWLIFVKVTEYMVSFTAGGVTKEYPVFAISQGSVQTVQHVLRNVIEGSKSKEVELQFSDGAIKCGNKSIGDESISIGYYPRGADYLIYPTLLELIVLGRNLDPEAARELGLENRLKNANLRMELKISHAAADLKPLGVTFGDVEEMVNATIAKAESKIKTRVLL